MKFTCDRKELMEVLKVVQRVTDQKSNIEVLRNVLLKASKDKLEIVGYNHRFGIINSLNSNVVTEGETTCPAVLFSEILSVMSSENVDIEVTDNKLVVKGNKSKYSLVGISAENFPKLPEVDASDTFELDSDVLLKGLKGTSYAIAEEDPRIFMNGVYVIFKDGTLSFVSTDGYRLSLHTVKDVKLSKNIGCIVPGYTVKELIKILPNSMKVKISLNKNQITFDCNNIYVTSRLLEADYPSYNRVIPNNTGVCRVNRSSFISALKGADIMARAKESLHIVELSLQDNVINISSNTYDVGSAKEEVEVIQHGKDIKMMFNSKYLLDYLNAVNDEEVVLNYSEEHENPFLFKTDADDHLYVLMPIKV